MSTQMKPTLSYPSFTRRSHWLDGLIVEVVVALQVLADSARAARPNPAGRSVSDATTTRLSEQERAHAAGLMRVNHVGEVCAQALYRGQALACRDSTVRDLFQHAAKEEVDHLAWCSERLVELASHPSVLNPVWYAGSFVMGVLAARAGIARNLGFMAETERQVEAHLDTHLVSLPAQDQRSRAIVSQMKADEAGHRMMAEQRGAALLPSPVRQLMKLTSRLMTMTAYRL